MEGPRETCAIENSEARHEARFEILAAQAGNRPTGPDESRKAPWQLSGRPAPSASLQMVLVSSQPFTVGRNPDNDLCVANPTVSKRHAELVLTEDGLLVRDLGSTNGTFLNGQRVGDLERLQDGDRLQFGTTLFTVRRCGQAQALATVSEDMGDLVLAYTQFDRLLNEPAVVPYFQPIVRFGDCRRVGFEVLARSRLAGLETPAQMFRVAAELDMEEELSRLMRREGLRIGRTLGSGEELYLNTHPAELRSPKLLDSLAELRSEFPHVAIVLEVHEAAATSLSLLASLRRRCDELEIRLAYDDFGAGQSRLLELAEVPPHVIKFDMHMIRGIARFPQERRQLVKSLVEIVRNLDVAPLAEGVETAEEAAACQDVGFELAQGYFFGCPAPARTWLALAPPTAS
jgi:EAL domain-containing protein (putative c-di-GMP-specific phosphodiesterase class I)